MWSVLVSVNQALLEHIVSSSSSWISKSGLFKTAIRSCLGLVLTNTTDLLNCFIGNESMRYTASYALTSLCVRNAEPTFLNWVFKSSVLASAATRLSSSPMALSVFII